MTINPSDESIYSYSNEGLKLSCILTATASDKKPSVTWTGPDGRTDSSKYRISKNNPNIHILSLTSSDLNGQYMCKFSFVEGSSTLPEGIFRNVNINMVEMVSPTALYSTYGVGIVVTLTCQVESPLKLHLSFYDGSSDLAPTNIKFDNGWTIAQYAITVDDANKNGTFSCKKSEREFSPTSTTLTVFSISPTLSSATKGYNRESVILTCAAHFHADVHIPSISWWREFCDRISDGSCADDYLVGQREYYLATETPKISMVTEDDPFLIISKLPITISSDNDGITYQCVAEYRGLAAGNRLISKTVVIMISRQDQTMAKGRGKFTNSLSISK